MAQQTSSTDLSELRIVSFNMHGFSQGSVTIADLINDLTPDILLLQEHWLTPANLSKFDQFTSFFTFGCSAMSDAVERGMLKGRPFGGVIMMINKNLRKIAETIHCSERYCIAKIANYVVVNVYLPCVGTDNRMLIIEDLLADISDRISRFQSCELLFCGDFNVDLDANDNVSHCVNNFIMQHALHRCDQLSLKAKTATYVNTALNHYSTIDYMLLSSPNNLIDFEVVDPDINFSDHLPILATVTCQAEVKASNKSQASKITQLRWDHADLVSYYYYTGCLLQPVLTEVNNIVALWNANNATVDYTSGIDKMYTDVVNILISCANSYVPQRRKNFYKFWWDEELNLLKEQSIDSNRLWKVAGKPRRGALFDKRQACRLRYRKRIRENQRDSTVAYSNDLNDALMNKHGTDFWKCWNSKFESKLNNCNQVDGCVDSDLIADKFAQHFATAYTSVNQNRADELKAEYMVMRSEYIGSPLADDNLFDVELVGKTISELKHGKAAGLDTLTADHLQLCHPILPLILAKLFNLMLLSGHVPDNFGRSFTIPLPKINDCRTKAVTTDDFRGIAISCVLSKVYELCVYERFKNYFISSDNQFGFKKGLGCSHAIYAVRNIVEHFVKDGATVNICALDLSKAFDKTDHNALFIKLMQRNLPIEVLLTLENWFSDCWTCIRWRESTSHFFQIKLGVRQGSVLSPFLFAVYVNEIIGRYRIGQGTFIVLYADDILLISVSICELQNLLFRCEQELQWLNMSINVKKSCCMRIGINCDVKCASIITSDGSSLPWVEKIRYLGVYFVQSRNFKCCFDNAKRSFYSALNAVFGKVGRVAPVQVVLELIAKKCLPILLYGLEACPLNKSDKNSLDFTLTRFLMKLFNTGSMDVVKDCQFYFNFPSPSSLVATRTASFVKRFSASENNFCQLSTNL